MTDLILLIVGCAAVVVLLACLKGFSQASRHKRVEGIFVRVVKSKGQLPGRPNNSLIDFPQRKPDMSREPAIRKVCSGTAALVEMAIIRGSRTIYSDLQVGSSDPRGARVEPNARVSRRGRLSDRQSGVQPSNNS